MMKLFNLKHIGCGLLVLGIVGIGLAADKEVDFEIRFLDAETGRGIPLVLLTTTHGVTYVSDNAGRIAYYEPGHAGQQVFFSIDAQGYEVPKDGFGIEGIRLTIQPGKMEGVKLKRINLAERLYRITGEGLYRDSVQLGHDTPLKNSLGSAKVVGQDSVQVAEYNGKLHWFWGDTNRLSYPLGLFRTAGAVSAPLNEIDPDVGIDLEYFTDENGFARNMIDLLEKEGVVWIDGLTTVFDPMLGIFDNVLVAHYSRRKGLAEQLEHGIAVYNKDRDVFTKATELEPSQNWQHLSNHPVIHSVKDVSLFQYFGTPFLITRVQDRINKVLDPLEYESWTCLSPDSDLRTAQPLRNESGELDWQWRAAPPVTPQIEARWLKNGTIKPSEAYYSPEDADDPGRRIQIHTGSVYYNEFRQRWIMVASEIDWRKDAPSHLGEVWYSESKDPQGPYTKAIKILTHNKQSFYNACQHPYFSKEDDRIIYFEGTYTNMFTNSPATPRYNYNQIMYRLDLSHPRIEEVFGKKSNNNG